MATSRKQIKNTILQVFVRPASKLRADIQALRAIAVLAVVVYHMWPMRLAGGFMGVDVFFVISGYLMTFTIWKGVTGDVLRSDAKKPGASVRFLLGFYARRIKRLAPPAIVLLAAVLIAVYSTDNFSLQLATAPQINASALFMQNWFLAGQAVDYLGADAGATAVQHFWSLSVEEQFYMIWPLLLLIAGLIAFAVLKHKTEAQSSHRGRERTSVLPLVVVAVFTVASFAYGFYLTYSNPAEAYFVTPARIWELSLGGIIVFAPACKNRDLRLLLPWLGLVMMAYPIIQWGGTNFPGWKALAPTLGTALVIWGGSEIADRPQNNEHRDSPFSVANLSRLRPAQFIGDISYSLYLWHWPLIVLVPFMLGTNFNHYGSQIKIAIFIASIVISWLSYILVENPTRHLGAHSRKPMRVVAATWACGILCLAIVLIPTQVVKSRAQDYTDNIVQKAFTRAVDAKDIGFGARATQHMVELGYDPYGKIDKEWSQFGSTTIQDICFDGKNVKRALQFDGREETDIAKTINEFGDTTSEKTILFLGDSYSRMWYPALDIAGKNLGYKIIGANASIPGAGIFELYSDKGDKFWDPARSISHVNKRIQYVKDNYMKKADVVIVGVAPLYIVGYFVDETKPDELTYELTQNGPRRLAQSFKEIAELTGRKPILIQSIPILNDNYNNPMDKTNINYVDKIITDKRLLRKYMDTTYNALKNVGASDLFEYLTIDSLFLDKDGNAHTQIGGVPVYYNITHINSLYAASAGEYFTERLRKLINGNNSSQR